MAMEVVCGNCQGRLLVEHTGVVVACPHCGAHLQIGDPAPPAVQAPPPSVSPPAPQFAPPQVEAPATFISQAPPPFQFAPPKQVPSPAPMAPPPVSPFPVSFEPPAVAASQSKAPPEPLFPEIILTPPASPEAPAPSTPVISASPEPVATPAWSPPPQVGTPSEPAASDSWMPQINLALPPAVVETPPPVPAPPPLAAPETATILMPAMPVVDASPSTVNLSPAPSGAPANQTDIWNPTRVEHPRTEETVVAFPGAEPSFTNFGNFNATPTVVVNPTPAAAPTVTPPVAPTFTPAPAAPPPAAAAQTAGLAIVTSTERHEATVPRVLFIIVASYASAITLALLYLWMNGGGGGSTLDLPDVRPKIKNGQFGLTLIDEKPLVSAYRLKLGESKRYGNLLVTPLKVTSSPLEFVHFGDEKQTKPPTATPVLKLWIKFENVSSDQTFPALDERLLYQRLPDKQNVTQDRTNNYVCKQSECKRIGKRVPVYTFPINGDWLLKGQELDTPIHPKEEWETYIPSNDEDLSELKGPLCWRVHFRKGYNYATGWGVTTLIEVEFDSKDIQAG